MNPVRAQPGVLILAKQQYELRPTPQKPTQGRPSQRNRLQRITLQRSPKPRLCKEVSPRTTRKWIDSMMSARHREKLETQPAHPLFDLDLDCCFNSKLSLNLWSFSFSSSSSFRSTLLHAVASVIVIYLELQLCHHCPACFGVVPVNLRWTFKKLWGQLSLKGPNMYQSLESPQIDSPTIPISARSKMVLISSHSLAFSTCCLSRFAK